MDIEQKSRTFNFINALDMELVGCLIGMKGGKNPLTAFLVMVIFVSTVTFAFQPLASGSISITIDGDMSDWDAHPELMVYNDTKLWGWADTQAWSRDMTKLNKGNTSEQGLAGAPFDEERDLEALYAYFGTDTVYFRVDVRSLPAEWWGYGGLNASVFCLTFDTDFVSGSGRDDLGSACDTNAPAEAEFERRFVYGDSGSNYAYLQDPIPSGWPTVDDTSGNIELAENRDLDAFEFSIPKSDFPAGWAGKMFRIIAFSYKPGEHWGSWGDWTHAFDPQAPGTPGENWGNPGASAAGSDLADVMPGGADGIEVLVSGTRFGRVKGYLEIGQQGPTAEFTYSPLSPSPNETVTFNASGSLPGWNGTHDVPIVSYEWDFGDGETGTGLIVYHNFTADGYYSVTLNVTDEQGSWDTASKIIKVSSSPFMPVFQKGMSYPSWSSNAYAGSGSDTSLYNMRQTNTEWVAIMPWWFQDTITSTKIYPKSTGGGWSPTNSSIIHAINRAHELGMKVMLKPMVDPLDGNWRGQIPGSSTWFQSYATFVNFHAELAEENGVELFCVGCEYNLNDGAPWTSSWRNIVAGVRQRYSGPITYAANHDHYQSVQWWDSLDYAGIDAYAPLTSKNDPTVEELKAGWSPHVVAMESWQATVNKPVVFTELGYRSADGANTKPWDWSSSMPLDLYEQVDCYNATFQVFYNKSWFYGFYWWNWETSPYAGGTSDTGFTPQNKPVQSLITSWYAKTWERLHGPTANFIYSPTNPVANSLVNFDASESSPGWNGTHFTPIANYTWNFGDGNITTVTVPTISHKFASPDTYTVTLNVTDSQGLWNTKSKTITVYSPFHDVAVISVTPMGLPGFNASIPGCDAVYAKWHPTWAYGFYIKVVVKNNGTFTENNVVVKLYNGSSLIGTTTIASFAAGAQLTLNFSWIPFQNLTFPASMRGYPWPYPTRTDIKANVTVVSGDVNITNNERVFGTLTIRYPGDAGKIAKIGNEWVYTPADGKVWIEDLYLFGKFGWGADRTKLGTQKTKYETLGFWCDFNHDGKVSVEDLQVMGKTWGDSPKDGVY